MSETDSPNDIPEGAAEHEEQESRAPHRVVGTPPPARARTLLGEPRPPEGGQHPRELPAGPDNPSKARKAERIAALFFIISGLASVGFIVAYVLLPVHTVPNTFRSNLALGGAMSVAFLGLGIGAVLWVRLIMPQVEMTEQRKPLASASTDRDEFAETFTEGAEASGFTKRPLLRRTLIAASVPLGLAPLILLRDLGPLPRTKLRRTVWTKGTRLIVYGPNTPLRASDFSNPGQMITVVPEGYQDNQDALAKATTIIIKFAPGQLQPPTVMNWTVDNIVAYSKICTHVGCPVALYEHTTHYILCPCHQSTFLATHGAKVIFGPAPRALPQLPIGTDSEGYLIATSDYHVPVGPGFWELGGSGFTGGNE